MRKAAGFFLLFLLVLTTVHCATGRAPVARGAGFRHSVYGPPHDPGPDYWTSFGLNMAKRFDGAAPEAIWIVSRKNREGTLLNFPASPRGPFIGASAEDGNEAALAAFDRAGYRVWLQVEPGNASVEELIDLVMTRYHNHPSVIGFGVDVEWYHSSNPDFGEAITDAEARSWLAALRKHNPNYRLFLKHWLVRKMPPTVRDGILFVNDGQIMRGLDDLVKEFAEWGRAFAPAPVAFQVGYPSDRPWWIRYDDPPATIGRELFSKIANTEAVFWVDFSALEVFRPPVRPRDASAPTVAERLGYAKGAKLLIIHADDFGMSHSVNLASAAALMAGGVNSASIMVPAPSFAEAAEWARRHPEADLGLHLTLTSEWASYKWGSTLQRGRVPSMLDEQGCFLPTEDVAAQRANVREAESEVRAQVEAARHAGIRPTHLDAHMRTLHMNAPLFEVLLRVSRDYRIPAAIPASFLDDPSFGPLITADDIVIDRFETIEPEVNPIDWPEYYANVIRNLKPGVTELIVHVAYDDEEMRAITVNHPNWGAGWRQRDFDFLTSEEASRLLRDNNVKLVTWREIGKLMTGGSGAVAR